MMESFIKAIGYVTIGSLVIIVGSIFGGYVAQILWHWFMVPTFGTIELTLIQAIGLKFLIAHFCHPSTDYNDEKPKWGQLMAKAFISPWIVLLLGYIIHLFY